MSRTSLSNLPVEIHCEILKYGLYAAQKEYHAFTKPDDEEMSVGWEWIDGNKRNISQFPYNVAAVCQLWYEILKKLPECWTRVIFDVSLDPHRFLDIFLWSKELTNLEITVFNSDASDYLNLDCSVLEYKRVSSIVDALRPHVSRCKYITFDTAFLTSLPSPLVFILQDAPSLRRLLLECHIDNSGSPEDYARICDLGTNEFVLIPPISSKPNWSYLSITGFWFMFLASHPYTHDWFRIMRGKVFLMDLCISHFQFQKEGEYTLQNFVSHCSEAELGLGSITLRDISLQDDKPIRENGGDDQFVFSALNEATFENVSSDVLQSLFFLINLAPPYLTFDNCVFPDQTLPLMGGELFLRNILPSSPENPNANRNFCDILRQWAGTSLTVHSCPSFDDATFLALLATTELPVIRTFQLSDCPNFTVHALKDFLVLRNRTHVDVIGEASDDYDPFFELSVSGNSPMLSEEDREWFNSNVYAQPIGMKWVEEDLY